MELKSTMLQDDWSGDLTAFNSFYDVFPAYVIEGGSWKVIAHYVAGNIAIGPVKDYLPLIVPCLLKDALFTPKSLPKAIERGLGSVGKQRSSAHMTQATWLVMDIDGLDQASFLAKVKALLATGCTFRIYSTHSHGRADKQGVRARLILPVDRALGSGDYEQAWLGLDKLMFNGEVSKADASGEKLSQQQGVWATAAERVELAFSKKQSGAVWSADTLLAAGPVKKLKTVSSYQSTGWSPSQQAERLVEALPWIDAENTPTWVRAVTAFKAAAPILGETNALELAVRYSGQGSEKAQELNDTDHRYNPETFFDNVRPTMPPDAGMGVLLGLAKEGALKVMMADKGKSAWSEAGIAAATYLSRYHYRLFMELTGKKVA